MAVAVTVETASSGDVSRDPRLVAPVASVAPLDRGYIHYVYVLVRSVELPLVPVYGRITFTRSNRQTPFSRSLLALLPPPSASH